MPAPFLQESRISNFCHRYNSAVADPGEGPGAAALYFWTKRRPAPLPPLSPLPYLKVWIRHYPEYCFLSQSRICAQIFANLASRVRSTQIPYPVDVSRNPAPYIVQIRDPGKILPEPEEKNRSRLFGNFCKCLTQILTCVAGPKKNGRAKGRHARGHACLLLAHSFFLALRYF